MVEVQKKSLPTIENMVLDDVADLVREERAKRFKFNGQLNTRSKGTWAWHERNIRQLRRLARHPKFKLIRDLYLELANRAEDIVFYNITEEEGDK